MQSYFQVQGENQRLTQELEELRKQKLLLEQRVKNAESSSLDTSMLGKPVSGEGFSLAGPRSYPSSPSTIAKEKAALEEMREDFATGDIIASEDKILESGPDGRKWQGVVGGSQPKSSTG